MSRQKTRRFADNQLRHNVIEPGKTIYEQIKGRWQADYFANSNPITLELGCGKGEYTVGLARHFPGTNYIGIDIKGDRIWVGSGIAQEENLNNVAFLRTQLQFLPRFFEKNEVNEIWLTFPDPRPRKRDAKRRLTFPRYMALYQYVLQPEGWFRFKTDNTPLFDYTLELLEQGLVKVSDLHYTYDLYQSDLLSDHHGIQTKYEKLFSAKGEKIKYLKFKFDYQ